jgi:galactose mutarotase-like enzyme
MADVVDAKENVVMAAGECEVTILPRFGGKIASICLKGRELLQQPLVPVALRTPAMGFEESDASGWDECLPSVAACSVPFVGGSAAVPDHGDLWRVVWEPIGTNDEGRVTNPVSFIGKSFSLPLELERKIDLDEVSGGWMLCVDYWLTNVGTAPVPWSWAAHPLFAAEPGDRIELPDRVRELRVEGSGSGRLGKKGDAVSWPIAKLAGGGETDLSVVLASDSGVGDKLFTGPLAADDNWCELVRPGAGVRISVRFDTEATPYLGLWICYGGWPEREGPKQMCVAMEPATAPVDSLAEAGSWSRVLGPGESYEWRMIVDLKAF